MTTVDRTEKQRCAECGLLLDEHDDPKEFVGVSSNQKLRRFSQWCLVSHGHDMSPRDRGEWVRYADAQAEIERLERELADALSLVSSYKPYQAERDRLERERDKWCNDAHSEAAANQGLRAALEQLRQARLTWGMACSHQCEACDEFWEAFRTAPGPGVLPNEAPPAKDEVLEAVRAGRVTYPPEVLPTGRWMPADETTGKPLGGYTCGACGRSFHYDEKHNCEQCAGQETAACICRPVGAGDGNTYVPNPRCKAHK